MSILISAHELSKAFSVRPLFSGLTFSIENGDRIGLIGPNGAGKSTLLRILAGQISQDDGRLACQRGLKVGFLEQVSQFSPDATILSSILEGTADAFDWENISKAHELIAKLELDRFPNENPISTLSGGWKKRVALARELIKNPDLLLLDEPTNHLDVEGILWLENFLQNAPFAVLTITHDRLFLQRVANRILELDRRHEGGLLNVKGDYATYLDVREQLLSAQERREVVLKNTLRRETEWLRQGAKARTTKQQARIQRQGELQNQVDGLSQRNQVRTARIHFQSAEKNPKKLIEAKGISKNYGDRLIFSPIDIYISPGTRLALLGANGSGKSTLIRVLLGLEKPSQGSVQHSDTLSIAYFDQTRDALDPDVTVAKTLCPHGDHVDYRGASVHIRGYLDRFLFTSGQMDMTVGKLSGGEQSRLLMARLMLTRANVLVLDEPTNDLDMATLTVLEECLTDFSGAVILVTHDRYFLDHVANRILAFPLYNEARLNQRKLVPLADLAQWEEWHSEQEALLTEKKALPEKPAASIAVGVPAIKADQKKRKLSFKEQRELDSMEATIQAAEQDLADLTYLSGLSSNQSNASMLAELTQKMAETQSKIEKLYDRWAELTKS